MKTQAEMQEWWNGLSKYKRAKTLKALKGSIAKWEMIVERTGVDEGTGNCPLCAVFWPDELLNDRTCLGCPVQVVTGFRGCKGSPYFDFLDIATPIRFVSIGFIAGTDKAKAAAQAELDFLRSLRPAEERT